MRAILLIVILAVVALIAAIASGFLNINQIRGAEVPAVSTTDNGVKASGGQTPAFDVETGSVSVGTTNATVRVPVVKVQPAPDGQQPPAAGQPAAPPTLPPATNQAATTNTPVL
jgi:hypothetical protein